MKASDYEHLNLTTNSRDWEWKRNIFVRGLFVGMLSRYDEAAIASARPRKRNDPELRLVGFAGLVCQACSDGAMYTRRSCKDGRLRLTRGRVCL